MDTEIQRLALPQPPTVRAQGSKQLLAPGRGLSRLVRYGGIYPTPS